MAASTSLTPAQRTERARKAALARTSIDAHIDALVRRAPEITPEREARLRVLLAPAGDGRAA